MMRRRSWEDRDYGNKFEYDPQWRGPLHVERRQTDSWFLVALCIFFVIWIGVGIYAISTGTVKSISIDFFPIDFPPYSHSTIIYIIMGFTTLGICLSLLYLILLRLFTKPVVFTTIFGSIATLVILFYLLIYAIIEDQGQTERFSIGSLIGMAIITLAFCSMPCALCLMLCRRKVLIACELVKQSSDAVLFYPSSFLCPILSNVLSALVVGFAACTWVSLQEDPSRKQGKNYHLYVLHGINYFGLFWMENLIFSFSQMVLSGTFATWYWTMDKKQVPNGVIFKFMYIVTRFHAGTLAFGSLIIAVFQAIRAFLREGSQSASRRGDTGDSILFYCLHCICGISEDIMRGINYFAYIMCSMHGTTFLRSAKEGFLLYMRNFWKIAVTTCVTGLIILSGIFLVTGLSVLATYAYCRNMALIIMVSAMAGVFIMTIIISATIFDVLNTAIDTIFYCVLIDEERNDGSNARPYYMSYELRRLIFRDV